MKALASFWLAGFCMSATFYGIKRLDGVEPIPWPILMVNLMLWPVPMMLALAAYGTGRHL